MFQRLETKVLHVALQTHIGRIGRLPARHYCRGRHRTTVFRPALQPELVFHAELRTESPGICSRLNRRQLKVAATDIDSRTWHPPLCPLPFPGTVDEETRQGLRQPRAWPTHGTMHPYCPVASPIGHSIEFHFRLRFWIVRDRPPLVLLSN